MARVNKMKGLDWIFCLAAYIVEHHLQDRFSLTFFGPFFEEEDKDEDDEHWWRRCIAVSAAMMRPAKYRLRRCR